MSTNIFLGHANLCDDQSGVKLLSTAFIHIEFPEETFSNNKALDDRQTLQALKEHWVTRGNELKVRLEVTLDNFPLSRRETRQLGNIIVESDVWSNLCVRPKLDIDAGVCSEDRCSVIQVEIDHDRTTKSSPPARNSASQICYGVNPGDISPQPGIPFAVLSDVYITAAFRKPEPHTEANSNRMRNEAAPRSDDDIFNSTQETLVDEVSQSAYAVPSSPIIDMSESASIDTHQTSSQTTLLHGAGEAEVINDCCDDEVQLDDMNSSDWMGSDYEMGHTSDLEHFSSITFLTDALLRLIIDSRVTLPKGVKLISDSLRERLCDIAPMLWMTGYASVRNDSLALN
jgi:hypothetical protein